MKIKTIVGSKVKGTAVFIKNKNARLSEKRTRYFLFSDASSARYTVKTKKKVSGTSRLPERALNKNHGEPAKAIAEIIPTMGLKRYLPKRYVHMRVKKPKVAEENRVENSVIPKTR